jgi:hypothetical protein
LALQREEPRGSEKAARKSSLLNEWWYIENLSSPRCLHDSEFSITEYPIICDSRLAYIRQPAAERS